MGCAASASVDRLSSRLTQLEAERVEDRNEIKQLKELIQLQQQEQQDQEQQQQGETKGDKKGKTLDTNGDIIVPHPKQQSIGGAGAGGGVETDPTPTTVAVVPPPVLKPLPPLTHVPTSAERLNRRIDSDIFLSHKRLDTGDFARTLKTELSDKYGLKCFLDVDTDFELGDLMSKVRGSQTLIFILSEHILTSEWCLLELREALVWGVNIVLMTSHGARWMVNGNVHDFPPSSLIHPEVIDAFANKAIQYHREFHSASIDTLVQRLFGRPVHAAIGTWKVETSKRQDDSKETIDTPSSMRFAHDLSTTSEDASSTALSLLPPIHPLQTFTSLTRWYAKDDEPFECGLDEIFHIHTASSTTNDSSTTSSSMNGKYLLEAGSPIVPSSNLDSTDPILRLPSQRWSSLVLDGHTNSIQTGVIELPHSHTLVEGEDRELLRFIKRYDLKHHLRGKPDLFISLIDFRPSQERPHEEMRRTMIFGTKVEEDCFELTISCSGPNDSDEEDKKKYLTGSEFPLDHIKIMYLAYDKRLNRTWTRGIEMLSNSTHTREEQTTKISFGVTYHQPPLIFLGLSGVFSGITGLQVDVRATDVTTTGATIVWTGLHQHKIHPRFKIEIETNEHFQPPPPMPSMFVLQWLAIPADPSQGGIAKERTTIQMAMGR